MSTFTILKRRYRYVLLRIFCVGLVSTQEYIMVVENEPAPIEVYKQYFSLCHKLYEVCCFCNKIHYYFTILSNHVYSKTIG